MKLEEIIVKHIPASMLERVVYDDESFPTTRREELLKQTGIEFAEVARRVVEAYSTHSARLAYDLYEQISDTDWKTAELLFEHFKSKDAIYHNHQASLVGRIPTLPLDELNDFLGTVKRQVCLIVAQKGQSAPARGTGFLVGSDLVLTCQHVLRGFPTNADLTNGIYRIEVYFDFFRGEDISSISPDLPQPRKVGLASQWYVDSRPATDPDGVVGELTEVDRTRIGSSLDFILLRLAEKVGLQTMERGGGMQRRWVDISKNALPKNVVGEDWIIIPQHPNGARQRIDLGRFRTTEPTNTRLRYDTNTAKGSSGAPCFNQVFRLVGVHNAYVGPEERPILNQAIRATCIAPLIEPQLNPAEQAVGYVPRWSLARDREPPRVILGREKILTWLQASATAKPKSLADRVYAAQADGSGAGCSFSIDLLHVEIRGTRTPRAVYTETGQQLPATVEDFILSLLRELGVQLEGGESIPSRPKPPSADPTSMGIGEVDKLSRWISQELPDWLGGVINRHVEKKIDAREEAKKTVASLELLQVEVPASVTATAEATEPVWVRPNAWDFAYIVIDDLRLPAYSGSGARARFEGEVRDLIAALVRGKTEAAMHPGLRRLRWMFLGFLPDSVPAAGTDGNGAILEPLNPKEVGLKEVLTIFDRMSQAHIRMTEGAETYWPVMADLVLQLAEMSAGDPWLIALQREASKTAAKILRQLDV